MAALRLNRQEQAAITQAELLMGYGAGPALLMLGALAAFLVALSPLLLLALNAFIRYVATLGNPYRSYGGVHVTSVLSFVPDVVLLTLFGAVLSFGRKLSIQQNRFFSLQTEQGPIRLGFDDLFGLVLGTPLLWYIAYRHDAAPLFFLTNLVWPVLGWLFAGVWEAVYAALVRRFITVPVETEVVVTVQRTLQDARDLLELFRVEEVLYDTQSKHLVVRGRGSQRYDADKGRERVRMVIREIPLLHQRVTRITIQDDATGTARPPGTAR